MCGATSRLRKTTTDFRIGAGAHLNDGVVQKSAFARFLASFDFRLFQQHRPGTDIGQNFTVAVAKPLLALSRYSFVRCCLLNKRTGMPRGRNFSVLWAVQQEQQGRIRMSIFEKRGFGSTALAYFVTTTTGVLMTMAA